MTQAPTPSPLSVGQEETVAFNLCAVHGFDPDFVKTQRDFALAVIREYEVVCRPQPSGETREALDRLKMAAHVYEDDEMAADCATLEAHLDEKEVLRRVVA